MRLINLEILMGFAGFYWFQSLDGILYGVVAACLVHVLMGVLTPVKH